MGTANREPTVDLEAIRSRFPALASSDVFMDNAGGSQLPGTVIDRVGEYMAGSFVQAGADYPAGRRANETIARARQVTALLMNAGDAGEVALGPSTSALCHLLADCYARARDPERDEIVVAEAGHEANVGPWVRLGERGYQVKFWRCDPETGASDLGRLGELLGERTRILAVPHVSNLLGHIEDVAAMSRMAHDVGARIVVDGVAFAPHRAMDVAAWGVDWYIYSVYKVYGPHMAALFGTHEAFAELEGPNHFFVDRDDVPYKFELGGVLHEGCAGILGVGDYLAFLGGSAGLDELDRPAVERAFARMTGLELPLQERLLGYLEEKDGVRIIGPAAADDSRVGTMSFVHRSRSSKEIVLEVNRRGVGIRYGHFYAHRLAAALGLDPDDGVVRTSVLHYNTPEEIERLIGCFEELF